MATRQMHSLQVFYLFRCNSDSGIGNPYQLVHIHTNDNVVTADFENSTETEEANVETEETNTEIMEFDSEATESADHEERNSFCRNKII